MLRIFTIAILVFPSLVNAELKALNVNLDMILTVEKYAASFKSNLSELNRKRVLEDFSTEGGQYNLIYLSHAEKGEHAIILTLFIYPDIEAAKNNLQLMHQGALERHKEDPTTKLHLMEPLGNWYDETIAYRLEDVEGGEGFGNLLFSRKGKVIVSLILMPYAYPDAETTRSSLQPYFDKLFSFKPQLYKVSGELN
jgi:hypothetical protein